MSSFSVSIKVVDGELFELLRMIGTAPLKWTAAVMASGAQMVANEWKSYALGAATPSGLKLKPNRELARSISVRKEGAFHWVIFSRSPVAGWAEYGTPARDLKLTHPYGRKSRVSAKKVPYLIVPFRHGVPSAINNPMPPSIYESLISAIREGDFKKSRVNPLMAYSEANFKGELIDRQGYDWGSRLEGVEDSFPWLGRQSRYYENMVAFNTASGGERKRSQYMTFRVISAKSKPGSWIVRARPGKYLAKQALASVRDKLHDLISQALKKDLEL